MFEETEKYYYRGFVKSKEHINYRAKVFFRVSSWTIKRDLLATANSSFTFYEKVPDDVHEGDIFAMYTSKGKIIYYGIVKSISEYSIECSQMQSFYSGFWICENYPQENTIENEFKNILDNYSKGRLKGVSYQDTLMLEEYGHLEIKVGSSTYGNLETYEENKTDDMENVIYDIYKKYNIVLDYNIPFKNWDINDSNKGSVTIKKASDNVIKIGNNIGIITEITPVFQLNDVNKLIIFNKNKTEYRSTFVNTLNNGIIEEPDSNIGRLPMIKTKIVYSDDNYENIIKSNMPDEMYNHEISFNLKINNNIYDFWNWELGQKMDIYNDKDYYNSIFTGYEIDSTDESFIEPISVKIICGKVRTALTKKLSLLGIK